MKVRHLGTSLRLSVLIAALAVVAAVPLSLAPAASAAPARTAAPAITLSSHVRVYGLAACIKTIPPPLPGPAYLAARVRFQAANGEAHDAVIWGKWNYYVDFNNVPANGEIVFAYVTCNPAIPNGRPSWGKEFRLTRQLAQIYYLNLLF
jgi:hypothetical protein